jgi:beta-galactosidase
MIQRLPSLSVKLVSLIAFLLVNASSLIGQEKISLDDNWRFHFGNSSNPEMDFGYGNTLILHKSN